MSSGPLSMLGPLRGTVLERIDVDNDEARTGDLLCLCEASVDRQDDGGFGVIEKLYNTRGRILPIEDDHNAPRLQRGKHGDKDPAILRHQDRHPVADPPARLDDTLGKAVSRFVQVRITDLAEPAMHRDAIGIEARRCARSSPARTRRTQCSQSTSALASAHRCPAIPADTLPNPLPSRRLEP